MANKDEDIVAELSNPEGRLESLSEKLGRFSKGFTD